MAKRLGKKIALSWDGRILLMKQKKDRKWNDPTKKQINFI